MTLSCLVGEVGFCGLKFLVDFVDIFCVGFKVGVAVFNVFVDAIALVTWFDDNNEENDNYGY